MKDILSLIFFGLVLTVTLRLYFTLRYRNPIDHEKNKAELSQKRTIYKYEGISERVFDNAGTPSRRYCERLRDVG